MKTVKKTTTAKPNKVYLDKMKNEFGTFPVLGNNQKVNRKTTVYYARKGNSSVFFLVRLKDAAKLMANGYTVQSIEVPKGHYPLAYQTSKGTKLETNFY